MPDRDGFHNGIYKNVGGCGHSAPVHERAEMLRAVAKGLIRAGVDRARRRTIIIELRSDFGVELSEHGLEHFLEP